MKYDFNLSNNEELHLWHAFKCDVTVFARFTASCGAQCNRTDCEKIEITFIVYRSGSRYHQRDAVAYINCSTVENYCVLLFFGFALFCVRSLNHHVYCIPLHWLHVHIIFRFSLSLYLALRCFVCFF